MACLASSFPRAGTVFLLVSPEVNLRPGALGSLENIGQLEIENSTYCSN